MKFDPGNKGSVRSLAALSVCVGLFVSLCLPGGGSRMQAQSRQGEMTSSQSESRIFSATATATTSGVLLQWQSSLDADNLGFNVYRLKDGRRKRVNREIIPGAVFVV